MPARSRGRSSSRRNRSRAFLPRCRRPKSAHRAVGNPPVPLALSRRSASGGQTATAAGSETSKASRSCPIVSRRSPTPSARFMSWRAKRTASGRSKISLKCKRGHMSPSKSPLPLWSTVNRRGQAAMENLGKRTVLILVAVFLVLNLGWFICLRSMTDTVVRCTYGVASLTCTPVSG